MRVMKHPFTRVQDNILTLEIYLQNKVFRYKKVKYYYGQKEIRYDKKPAFLVGFCIAKKNLVWYTKIVRSPLTDLEIVIDAMKYIDEVKL